MKVFLNDRPIQTQAHTLADFLAEQLSEQQVATALNGTFIAHSQRATTVLNDGDRIEALVPMQGG